MKSLSSNTQNRPDRKIIIGLILATTLPFLLLFTELKDILPITDLAIFWTKFISIAASLTGFIGGMLMIWSAVLGIKPIISLLTPDIIWATNVHKWIGRYGVLIAFAHPVLEMVNYMKGVGWLFVPNFATETETFISLGRFSFILLLIIYVTSALIRGRLKYRPWKYIHNLSYPAVYFIFPHSINIGSYLDNYVGLKALWLTFFGLFIIAVLYRLLEWIGVLRPKYTISNKFHGSSDIYTLTLKPKNRAIRPLPGQFVLIQLKAFGESHPFTVMKYDEVSNSITLGVKSLGRFTKKLDKIRVGSQVRLSGPFGVFTRECHNQKPKILIAGGIGITPFIDVIHKFANDKTILLYSNKTRSQVLFHDEFKAKLGPKYRLFITGDIDSNYSNTIYHRIDSPSLLKVIGQENKPADFQYFLCGSKEFMVSMTNIIKSNSVPSSQIHKEEFTY
jgi:predicted ferric reductase